MSWRLPSMRPCLAPGYPIVDDDVLGWLGAVNSREKSTPRCQVRGSLGENDLTRRRGSQVAGRAIVGLAALL